MNHMWRGSIRENKETSSDSLCVVYRYGAFNWLLDSSFPAVMEKSINASHWNMSSTLQYIPCLNCAGLWSELVWAQVAVRVSSPKTAACFCTQFKFTLKLLQFSVLITKKSIGPEINIDLARIKTVSELFQQWLHLWSHKQWLFGSTASREGFVKGVSLFFNLQATIYNSTHNFLEIPPEHVRKDIPNQIFTMSRRF